MSTAPRRPAAFTLIELLVVVSIIALLISILVPSLAAARKMARTVVCGTNLRSITQAMNVYATEWNGAILGNSWTSGSGLYANNYTAFASGISNSNVPDVLQGNDWMSPTAHVMNIQFNTGPTPSDRIDRFMLFSNLKVFVCPANSWISTAYTGGGGPNFPVHRAISYATAAPFQNVNYTTSSNTSFQGQFSIPSAWITLPNVYRPNVNKVGQPSQKVYIADGTRWFSGGNSNLALTDDGGLSSTSVGGLDQDYGPWDANTRAYNKGNKDDGRVVSMRHGTTRAMVGLGSYKMNMAFFDNHVETLNGLDAADPSLWVPSGGKPANSEAITQADWKAKYMPNGNITPIR